MMIVCGIDSLLFLIRRCFLRFVFLAWLDVLRQLAPGVCR